MTELLGKNPEIRTTLLTERVALTRRLTQLAMRKILLENLLAETEAECEATSDRIGDILNYLGMPVDLPRGED